MHFAEFEARENNNLKLFKRAENWEVMYNVYLNDQEANESIKLDLLSMSV